MSRTTPSPEIRELAQRLLAYEAAADNPSGADAPAGFRVVDKLRGPLSTLAGIWGFRAVLGRSLRLARAEAPGLSAVQILQDGSLEGFSDLGNPDHFTEEGVMLIAHLLSLLVALIGESLMLNLVLDVWPEFSVVDYGSVELRDGYGPTK